MESCLKVESWLDQNQKVVRVAGVAGVAFSHRRIFKCSFQAREEAVRKREQALATGSEQRMQRGRRERKQVEISIALRSLNLLNCINWKNRKQLKKLAWTASSGYVIVVFSSCYDVMSCLASYIMYSSYYCITYISYISCIHLPCQICQSSVPLSRRCFTCCTFTFEAVETPTPSRANIVARSLDAHLLIEPNSQKTFFNSLLWNSLNFHEYLCFLSIRSCFPHFSFAFRLPCLLMVTSAPILGFLFRHFWTCADIDPRRRRALPQCRFESLRWGTRGQSEDWTSDTCGKCIGPRHGTTAWENHGVPRTSQDYNELKRARTTLIIDASESRENIKYCTTKSTNRWGRQKGRKELKWVNKFVNSLVARSVKAERPDTLRCPETFRSSPCFVILVMSARCVCIILQIA